MTRSAAPHAHPAGQPAVEPADRPSAGSWGTLALVTTTPGGSACAAHGPDVDEPAATDALLVRVAGGDEGDALAVTVEPRGGSEQPTTDPIVVLAASEA
jgi:hypothetical protein